MIKQILALSLALIFGFISMGHAKKLPHSTEPVLMYADNLTFDKEKNIVTAKGHVEVYQEQEVLTADEISYDRKQDKIVATGNVVWQKESGDFFFGQSAELQDRMKNGVLRELRALLADESRLAANLATRRGGIETQMNQVVYSPCRLCKESPNEPPIWQLKSQTVLWDEVNHDIIHTDSTMEFNGVPILYTPYLRHPDPSVKQRSGLLAPGINANTDKGLSYYQPIYYVFSPDKDITVMPLITQKKGFYLSSEYRQRLQNTYFNIGGSIGVSEKLVNDGNKRKARGHVDSSFKWDMNDNWRMSGHVLRSTNPTYLKQFPFYGYSSEKILTSYLRAEGFYGLSYMRAQGLAYQGLRATDRQKTVPIVAPVIDINYVSPAQYLNSRFFVDANTMLMTRKLGTNVQRLSTTASWKLPFVSGIGDRYTLSIRARADGYHYNHFTPLNQLQEIKGSKGRLFTQGFLEWEYPWMKNLPSGHVVIAPLISLVVAPKLENQRLFPNEDCVNIEPNDEYLMSHSRFPGLDIIDDGSRINYGFKVDTRINKDIKGGLFIGQTASFSRPNINFVGTGFERRMSDFMGRVNLHLFDYIDARYRFRLDRKTLKPLRNELETSFGVPELKLKVKYIKLQRFLNEPFNQVGNHQIALGASSQFAKNWTAGIKTVHDLGQNNRALSHLASIAYENECLGVTLQLNKTFYRDREVNPGKGFMFVIALKTLAGQTMQQIKLKQESNDEELARNDGGMFSHSD